jgi:hypothetical protein
MARLGKEIKDVIRGDTRQVSCTFLEADKTTPINLTGGTAYFTVQASSDPTSDSTVVIQKTATSFTDAANGQHTFTLTHDDTNIDPTLTYWYDAQYVDSTGNYLSSYKGKFIMQSDITRT